MFDVAIIGCGIVGASIAYQLAQYKLNVVVLEKENDIAMGTTKANSGILHSGYDPEEGTLMAKLNVQGAKMAKELCSKLHVHYKQTGSLVLAFSEEDVATLHTLLKRGINNGVEGLEIISADRVREMEPYVSDKVVAALYSPTAAVVSPWDFALALAEVAVKNGVKLQLETQVTEIVAQNEGYVLKTNKGEYSARFVINAAGVSADVVHNMVAAPEFVIKPNKGEYYLLDKDESYKASNVIFQCPSVVGKGILVAPTAHGNIIVGPDAQAIEGEDSSTSLKGLSFIAESAVKSVPDINLRANIRNFAGVRALSDQPDFIIAFAKGKKDFIDVAGIKSPGLTAAPAIGKMVAEILHGAGLSLERTEVFDDSRAVVRFRELSVADKRSAIEKNPAYGRVICRCETITEGEILDALHAIIPATSLDGVKRRTSAGMGRCQGGFCGPRVLELIAHEQGTAFTDVVQEGQGTYILTAATKKRSVK